MLSPLVHSVIRTGVPALVGALVGFLVARGLTLPPELVAQITATLSLLAQMLYYLAARLVEQRAPAWSWLLGSPSRPVAYESREGDVVVERDPGRHA